MLILQFFYSHWQTTLWPSARMECGSGRMHGMPDQDRPSTAVPTDLGVQTLLFELTVLCLYNNISEHSSSLFDFECYVFYFTFQHNFKIVVTFLHHVINIRIRTTMD